MRYTAIVEQFATESHSYTQTVVFEAKDDTELQRLLDAYANGVPDAGIRIDDSKKPPRFDESGGFASSLRSFVDENGRDVSHLTSGEF